MGGQWNPSRILVADSKFSRIHPSQGPTFATGSVSSHLKQYVCYMSKTWLPRMNLGHCLSFFADRKGSSSKSWFYESRPSLSTCRWAKMWDFPGNFCSSRMLQVTTTSSSPKTTIDPAILELFSCYSASQSSRPAWIELPRDRFEEDMSLSSRSDAARSDRHPARSARYKDCPTSKEIALEMFYLTRPIDALPAECMNLTGDFECYL